MIMHTEELLIIYGSKCTVLVTAMIPGRAYLIDRLISFDAYEITDR